MSALETHSIGSAPLMIRRRGGSYTLDPYAIGAAMGLADIRPFVLVALAASPAPGLIVDHWPDPARHLPRPPNNHLSYVITWYGLAIALLAIFTIWARKGSRA